MRCLFGITVFLLAVFVSNPLQAAACTYHEAVIALGQGNNVRGMVLMRMARRDGDERASRFLAGLLKEKDLRQEVTSVSQGDNNPLYVPDLNQVGWIQDRRY